MCAPSRLRKLALAAGFVSCLAPVSSSAADDGERDMLRSLKRAYYSSRPLGSAASALEPSCATAGGATVQPPFCPTYTIRDLGSIAGLPPSYGGLTFDVRDPDTILIGGSADTSSGKLYAVGVVRGEGNHVEGFVGMASVVADAANNDGGVAFGPSDVLFLARYPNGELGQIKPGSSVTDKVIPLGPLGFTGSPGGLNFVPPGFPGAGQLKVVSYNTGDWYTLQLAPDGNGTFDVLNALFETNVTGGPEGIAYVPPGSPFFASYDSVLVGEYNSGVVSTYNLTGNGDPVAGSRTVFVDGLTGAEGATIDPLTGDFFFSTFGGGNKVIVVTGFQSPSGTPTPTPTPSPTPPPGPTPRPQPIEPPAGGPGEPGLSPTPTPTPGATPTPTPGATPTPTPGATPTPTPGPPGSADLSLQVTASPQTLQPGGLLTCSYQVDNAGPAAATGVQLTAQLGPQLSFESGAGCTASGQTVTCNVGAVAANGATASALVTGSGTTPGTRARREQRPGRSGSTQGGVQGRVASAAVAGGQIVLRVAQTAQGNLNVAFAAAGNQPDPTPVNANFNLVAVVAPAVPAVPPVALVALLALLAGAGLSRLRHRRT